MDIYMDFVNDLTEMIDNINVANNIIAVYVGGSVSRGDYVVGVSDIDIYVVTKDSEENNTINTAVQSLAYKKIQELLSWCPDGVTVAFTTYKEIKSGVSWLGAGSEYYTFQENAKLLYGKDIRKDIIEPTENDIRKSSEQAIAQIKHIVQQDLSNIKIDKYFIRGIFGTAFSAMHFYLCLHHQYIRGKQKITDAYCEINQERAVFANSIMELWYVFSHRPLYEIEIKQLITDTIRIIEDM
ncbi:MAG: nucleotidyltransferase domain-containing protein [Oscillospiraceae bacterium]|nr:nucleotidyltransferase domain-containing protein [Oscillospiraceae bacterium]